MPRGVYDRSAKKNAAPKNAAVKTEKKARAPWGSKKAVQATATETKYETLSLTELASLRSAFTGPQPNTLIIGKIDTLIVRQLDVLVGTPEVVEVKQAKPVQVQQIAPIQAPAPIQAAAPFNPSIPTNGQA
jgi:hypothetical protein